jgi:predicted outer membrane repeat protein
MAYDFDITDDLIIEGEIYDPLYRQYITKIDAQQFDRIFDIYAPVTLRQVLLVNGNPGANGDGGAIRINPGGSLILDDSNVEDNTARDGGAIFSAGTLTVKDSEIIFNNAINGGGIAARSGINFEIISTWVGVNRATNGGGIAIYDTPGSITGSPVTTNGADYGAGIYHSFTNSSHTVRVLSSTIFGNLGKYGAGIYITGAGGAAHTELIHATISQNTANKTGMGSGGGVMDVATSGQTTLFASILYNNTAYDGINNCINVHLRGYNMGAFDACQADPNTPQNFIEDPKIGWDQYTVDVQRQYLYVGNPFPHSPAIDMIPIAECITTVNQLNSTLRPFGDGCDIGAIEASEYVKRPANFMVNSATKNTITLTWVDNSGFPYKLADSLNGSAWQPEIDLPENTITYTYTGLTCNTIYFYRLYAFGYDEFYSPYVYTSGSTLPCIATPAAPTTSNTTTTATTLHLTQPTPDIDNLLIERAQEIVGGQTVGALALSDWVQIAEQAAYNTIFEDTSLACGTTYYYRVRTYRNDDQEYSAYSNTTTVVTLPCPVPVTNTVGLYKDGVWLFRDVNATGVPDIRFLFGPQESGWSALTGDWDGDGEDGIGLYKNGIFALRNVSDGGIRDVIFRFGSQEAGWQPIIGDWNGDGTDTIGLFKNGLFILRDSNSEGAPDYTFMFGDSTPGWVAVAGDWDASGADSVGLYRSGLFYQTNTLINPIMTRPFQFGPTQAGWLPVTGDWNGDGFITIGVYQTGVWRLRNLNNAGGVDLGFSFGEAAQGWQPLASYRGSAQSLTLMGLSAGFTAPLPGNNAPTEATPTPILPEPTVEAAPTLPAPATEAAATPEPTTETTPTPEATAEIAPSTAAPAEVTAESN